MRDRKSYALEGLEMVSDQLEATQKARQKAMLRAHAAGANGVEIATAAHMSRQAVYKFLRKSVNLVDKTA